MVEPYSSDDVAALAAQLRERSRAGEAAGEALRCPLCRGPLDERAVPPRADVSYVRDRIWLVCTACARTAVLDRPHNAP